MSTVGDGILVPPRSGRVDLLYPGGSSSVTSSSSTNSSPAYAPPQLEPPTSSAAPTTTTTPSTTTTASPKKIANGATEHDAQQVTDFYGNVSLMNEDVTALVGGVAYVLNGRGNLP